MQALLHSSILLQRYTIHPVVSESGILTLWYPCKHKMAMRDDSIILSRHRCHRSLNFISIQILSLIIWLSFICCFIHISIRKMHEKYLVVYTFIYV